MTAFYLASALSATLRLRRIPPPLRGVRDDSHVSALGPRPSFMESRCTSRE
jgi:hypothetical protein